MDYGPLWSETPDFIGVLVGLSNGSSAREYCVGARWVPRAATASMVVAGHLEQIEQVVPGAALPITPIAPQAEECRLCHRPYETHTSCPSMHSLPFESQPQIAVRSGQDAFKIEQHVLRLSEPP